MALFTGTPSKAADGFLAPVCANGEVRHVWVDFESENDVPDSQAGGCHGPCLHERRLGERRAGLAKRARVPR
ncbi:MAG: hypothetical protein ACX939_11200 [Hyphococcus sp.]